MDDPALATSAIRVLPRWLKWPKYVRSLAWRTLQHNVLSTRFYEWVRLGHDAPDFNFVGHVLLFGMPLGVDGNRPPPTASNERRNHRSATDPAMREAVQRNRLSEAASGLLVRIPPHHAKVFNDVGFGTWSHPIGAVPKFNGTQVCGTRVIDDYSFPPGRSVNDHINYLRLRYDKVDAALAYMHRHPNCYAAKIDIKGFFRHIAIDPYDWPLMGAEWDFGQGPEFLFDTHMPFGLRHAPEGAGRFSAVVLHAVHKLLHGTGISLGEEAFVSVVVDDWLILAVDLPTCTVIWNLVLHVLQILGFDVNLLPHKLLSPRQQIVWLGLLFDTVSLTVKLSADKVAKGLALLHNFLSLFQPGSQRKITRHELDSLIGYLSYCAGVVYGGRAFLHRLRKLRFRDEEGHVRPVHHRIYLNLQSRADGIWWVEHLSMFNGAAQIVDPADDCTIHLDATGEGGLGIFCDGAFVSFSPSATRASPVCTGHPESTWANSWELFNFVVLLRLFGHYLRDKVISPLTDNMFSVGAIRRWNVKSLDAEYCSATLRTLFSLCVVYNIRIRPTWIPGEENVLADALSREYWDIASDRLVAYTHQTLGRKSAFCASLRH